IGIRPVAQLVQIVPVADEGIADPVVLIPAGAALGELHEEEHRVGGALGFGGGVLSPALGTASFRLLMTDGWTQPTLTGWARWGRASIRCAWSRWCGRRREDRSRCRWRRGRCPNRRRWS